MMIDGENLRTASYISHPPSRGVAREAILRHHLRQVTNAPLLIQTGVVRWNEMQDSAVSRQCDIVVFDPTIDQPLYSIEDFVVVTRRSSRFVIEVKSKLDKKTWGDVLAINYSLAGYNVPYFSFAFTGVSLDTFLIYLKSTHDDTLLPGSDRSLDRLPMCHVCHEANYLGVRPKRVRNEDEDFFCVLEFNEKQTALATAHFFDLYITYLNEDYQPDATELRHWLDETSDQVRKHWFYADGTIKNHDTYAK